MSPVRFWASAPKERFSRKPKIFMVICGSSSAVECLLAKEEVASSNLVFRSIWVLSRRLFEPKWRKRQTRQSQKLLEGNLCVGSSPTFGRRKMPSSAAVAQRTLDPLTQVRILARQPIYFSKPVSLLVPMEARRWESGRMFKSY